MTLRDSPDFNSFGYWPNTPSQWREPTVDDCTWYAGEFAWQAADRFHRNFHPVNDLRNKSADTEGGTTVLYMSSYLGQAWPKDGHAAWGYRGWTKRELKRALWGGASLVIGGDYEKLPVHYRRWTFNDEFNHAMAVRHIRLLKTGVTVVGLYDPLGGGPQRSYYDGEWIRFNALFGGDTEYTWREAPGRYLVSVVDNQRRDKTVKRLFFEPSQVTRVAQVVPGTPVFQAPNALSTKMRVLRDGDRWYKLAGRVDSNWFMMFVWNKDTNSHDLGYIVSNDIAVMKNIQIETDSAQVAELEEQLARERSRADIAEGKVEASLGLVNSLVDTLGS